MKLFVCSDIHGSIYYVEKMIEAYKNEKCDRMILLGDILYHGPRNDLPKDYNPKAVLALLNQYKEDIISVKGNCDGEVDQMVLDFSILSDYTWILNDDLTIFVTHGHIYNKTNMPKLHKGDILLHGHTHVPAKEIIGDNYYLNPGSITMPKENSWHGYMTIENNTFKWIDIDGNVKDELKL